MTLVALDEQGGEWTERGSAWWPHSRLSQSMSLRVSRCQLSE